MAAKKAKGKKEWGLYLKVTLWILAILLAAAGWKVYEDVLASNINLDKGKTASLYIYTDKDFDVSFGRMKQSRVMKDPEAFRRLVAIFHYESKLKPGRYQVSAGMSNLELMRMMAAGRQQPVNITFKYAERKSDLASFWGQQLETDSNELIALLNDRSFLDSMMLDTATAISVFIPNTYNMYWNTSAEKLLRRMAAEYRQFWDSTRIMQSEALGLTPAQVSTLASIVQKETYRKDEMPVVAGVYYNRLQKGMAFQADPTVIYAMNDRSIRRVSGKMLDNPSPYNTYRHTGLPPGPICVPSITAIDAVLGMDKNNYIYFCAKEDLSGYHNFAATFAQHQQNARRYQRMLNNRGIR